MSEAATCNFVVSLTITPQAHDKLQEADTVVAVLVEAPEQSGGGSIVRKIEILSKFPQRHHTIARLVHLGFSERNMWSGRGCRERDRERDSEREAEGWVGTTDRERGWNGMYLT